MSDDIYQRADLLGISVYELINNYVLIYDCEGFFYGFSSREDVDKYLISHSDYSDSMVLVDLSMYNNKLQVLKYEFLEKILEE